MRLFLPTTALLCAVFLSACGSDNEGPDTKAIETAIEQEIDRLIGGDPALVNLGDLTMGEAMEQSGNAARFDATWTGTVVVEGPLYRMDTEEMFGAQPFVTVSPTDSQGKTFEVKGTVHYVLRDGGWVANKKPSVLLENDNQLTALGTSLAFANDNGTHPLAGTPEAANKRAAMAAEAQAEAEKNIPKAERIKIERAKRDAELKALVEEQRLRKAEEAHKVQEAEAATQP